MSQNEHAPWDRRKSSNVSGDSVIQGRQSLNKSAEFPPDRRGSQQSQVMQSPTTTGASHSTTQSPAIQYSQPSQDARSSAGSAYHARAGSNNLNAPGEHDEVARQKQLMKEKREEAIKRRREEEEREAAEKKERIRKKMEELGLEPLKEQEAIQKEIQPMAIEKRPVEAAKSEAEQIEAKDPGSVVPKDLKVSPKSPAMITKSPPKPPAPSTSGVPQQYGMMKVHGSAPRDPLSQVTQTLNAEKSRLQPVSQNISSLAVEAPAEVEKGPSSSLANGVSAQKAPDPLFQRSPELPSQRPVGDSRQQPWNSVPRDSKLYAGWNPQQASRESNNVWGAPTQARPLGNGTFDRTIQRPQSRPQDQYPSPALAPIGPPKHVSQARDGRDTAKVGDTAQTSNVEDSQTIPTFPILDTATSNRLDVQGRKTNGEQRLTSPQFPPGVPLGPQNMENLQRPQSSENMNSTLAAWGSFQTSSAREDNERRRQWQREQEAIADEEARTGVRFERLLPNFAETWKQVKVDDQSGGRSIVGVSKAQNAHGLASNIHTHAEIRSQPFVNSMDVASAMPGGLGRGSRFFPSAGRLHPFQQTSAPFAPFHRRSDSPPPPDSTFHPVQSSDSRRVVVRLPSNNDESRIEKPKVKLPPAVVTPVQSPQMSHVQPLPLRAASQPLVNNPSWQDRFNGLLGVKKATSPEKSTEKRVAQIMDFSATKEPLDLPTPRLQAAVALPPQSESSGSVDFQVASQDPQDEEALFEPESGSTPAILFPTGRPTQAWPLKRGQLRPLTPSIEVEAVTKEALKLPDLLTQPNLLLIFVKLNGQADGKSKTMRLPPGYMPVMEASTNQASPRQQASANRPKQQGKGFKPREPSGSFNHNTKSNHNAPQKNGGNGQPRNNYQRNPHPRSRTPSTPQQRQPAPWEHILA